MSQNEEQKITNNDGSDSGSSEVGSFVWDLVKVLVFSLIIIWPVRHYVAEPFIVSGSSMEPTFHTGEYLIINQLAYRMHEPERGDVIVFKYPKDNTQYFIKRIIGLPGERVVIENNKVTVFNKEHPTGWTLDETYLPPGDITLPVGENSITLGSGEYYVLGDNRLASSDSRFWGPVPKQDIIGKVFVRAYPFQSFTKFNDFEYSSK